MAKDKPETAVVDGKATFKPAAAGEGVTEVVAEGCVRTYGGGIPLGQTPEQHDAGTGSTVSSRRYTEVMPGGI